MADDPFRSREIAPAATGFVSVEQQRAIAEVQARMVMARGSPRDQQRALELILDDCKRLSLAEEGLYEYARGGTEIRGASIKLMQAIASRWGNVQSGIKVLDRRDGYTECAAFAWDLESNFYDERQFRVSHTRTTRRGSYRLTDDRDLYEAEANAGQRRKRAALEAVIPSDVVKAAEHQCDDTMLSNADISPEGQQKLVMAFARFGVTQQQIEARIQRKLDAIRPRQVVQLKRIWKSLDDNMSSPDEWFQAAPGPPPPGAQPPSQQPPTTGNEALRSALRQGQQQTVKPEPFVSDVTEPAEAPSGSTPDPASAGAGDDTPPASPSGVEEDPRPPATSGGAPQTPAQRPPRQRAQRPAPPGDAPSAPPAEASAPIEIAQIKPVRLANDRGWDWKRYADEYIDAALKLPPSELGRYRGRQSSMFEVLRNSDKEEWSRCNQALANYERDGTQPGPDNG